MDEDVENDARRIASGAVKAQGKWWVPVACHEWRGPRIGENRGYVCAECGAEVESAFAVLGAPKCHERLAPLDWLGSKMSVAVLGILEREER